MPSIHKTAFTAPINPPGATPVLTKAQVWAGLILKTHSAETFIPNAITATNVISERVSESEDVSTGNIIPVREVFLFRENQQKIKERGTAYEDASVDFVQPDRTFIGRIISEGAGGQIYLTYILERHHQGMSKEELDDFYAKERNIAQHLVEGMVDIIRELFKEGKS